MRAERSASWPNGWTRIRLYRAVYYPGLGGSPAAAKFMRSNRSGYGAVVSFDIGAGERAKKRAEPVKLPLVAVSLGAVESILSYPAMMSHAAMPPEVRHQRGITDGCCVIPSGWRISTICLPIWIRRLQIIRVGS